MKSVSRFRWLLPAFAGPVVPGEAEHYTAPLTLVNPPRRRLRRLAGGVRACRCGPLPPDEAAHFTPQFAVVNAFMTMIFMPHDIGGHCAQPLGTRAAVQRAIHADQVTVTRA